MASDAELRSALEWESSRPQPQDKTVFEWLWQAVQGDFDDNRSTGQIAFDTAISMIPVCWSNFPGHLDRWTSPGRGR
jgi:hypothetical protein